MMKAPVEQLKRQQVPVLKRQQVPIPVPKRQKCRFFKIFNQFSKVVMKHLTKVSKVVMKLIKTRRRLQCYFVLC